MGRDGPVECSCPRDAASGDARRGGPEGDRGPQPPACFGNFSAVKSSPPEAGERLPMRTRHPGCREQPHRQHLSVALRAPPLLKERL